MKKTITFFFLFLLILVVLTGCVQKSAQLAPKIQISTPIDNEIKGTDTDINETQELDSLDSDLASVENV